MNFKNFLDISEICELGSIVVPESFDWATKISRMLPSMELDLPTTQRTSEIEAVYDKKNPIAIQLKDGTKLFFTYDEFRRIDGVPAIGKKMVVTMQRLPHDNLKQPSKITHCKII